LPATPRPDPRDDTVPSSRRQTLPRGRILRGRRHFDAAFKTGRRFSSRCLTLLTLPRDESRPDLPHGEVAFLTPKRIGDAVVRNKVRRRLREGYRRHFTPETTRRLIWLAKGPATALDFGELVTQMKELYARSLATK
jgi:ribonuclease P protein component